jgi:hypothetical protein
LTIAIKVWVEVLIGKKSDNTDDDTVVIRRGGNKTTNKTADDDGLSGITMLTNALSESLSMTNTDKFGSDLGDSAANGGGGGLAEVDLLQRIGGQPKLKRIVLEILIGNQLLYVNALDRRREREHLIGELYEFSSVITTQKRIQHSRYGITMEAEAEAEFKMTYKNLQPDTP